MGRCPKPCHLLKKVDENFQKWVCVNNVSIYLRLVGLPTYTENSTAPTDASIVGAVLFSVPDQRSGGGENHLNIYYLQSKH